MDEAVWLWLVRLAAVGCAGLAGFAFSRSTPAWQEDAPRDRLAMAERMSWHAPFGDGFAGWGLLAGCLWPMQGAAVALLASAAAIYLAWLGWPPQSLTDGLADGSVQGGTALLFMLLFEPGLWAVLLGAGGGYVAGHYVQERAMRRIRPRGDFDD